MLRNPSFLAGSGTALLLAALGLAWLAPDARLALALLIGGGGGLLLAGMLRWQQPDGCDTATPGLRRRYLREFVPPMVAYVLLLSASLWLLKRVEEPLLRGLVALMPVVPIALVLRAIIRYIRDTDELQRRIELEAVSFSSALVSLLYLAGGFLQQAGVIDIPAGTAMIWVFPLVCFAYGIAKGVVARRYR